MKYSPFINHKLPKEKPFLILGKGPSLEKVLNSPQILDDYTVISLNQAGILHIKQVDYVHFVDMDVPYSFKDQIPKVKNWICPWKPHVDFKPSFYPLHKYQVTGTHKDAVFYWYNTSKVSPALCNKAPLNPVIKLHYFSAEAVFQLLWHQGVTTITTAGIDGGKEYHHSMYEIGLKPLTNGQPTFDKGYLQIDKICKLCNIKWIRLS